MRTWLRYVSLLALGFVAGPLPAAVQDRAQEGAFVIRLGSDTTAVERFTSSAARLEGDGVYRAPRTLARHYVFDFGPDGRVQRAEIVVQRLDMPSGAPPIQRTIATFTGDSAVVEIRRDTVVQTRRVAVGAAVPVVAGAATSFASFELLVAALRRSGRDSIAVPIYLIGAQRPSTANLKTMGRDSVWVYDGNNVFHVRVDRDGRILGAVPRSGTQQFSIERVANVDVAALGRTFAGRDQVGQGLGQLSTRDTVRASVGGAALWIDYGRPAKRGRVIFGSTVVPWNEVWRTGANAATQLRTDRDLVMGGVTIPAGFYTLWTLPSPTGWKLIVNQQTGQWGTDYHADRDLVRIDLPVSTLATPVERFTITMETSGQGGSLVLEWDNTRASLPFTVR